MPQPSQSGAEVLGIFREFLDFYPHWKGREAWFCCHPRMAEAGTSPEQIQCNHQQEVKVDRDQQQQRLSSQLSLYQVHYRSYLLLLGKVFPPHHSQLILPGNILEHSQTGKFQVVTQIDNPHTPIIWEMDLNLSTQILLLSCLGKLSLFHSR